MPKLGSKGLQVYVPYMQHLGEFHSPRVEWLSRKLKHSPGSGSKILISNEGILGHYSDFYHDRLTRLQRFQESFDHPFRVLLTIRPKTPWIQSCYFNYISEGGTKNLTQFEMDMSKKEPADPLKIVEDLSVLFGKDRISVIDTSESDAVVKLAEVMGLSPDYISKVRSQKRLNESRTHEDFKRIQYSNANGSGEQECVK